MNDSHPKTGDSTPLVLLFLRSSASNFFDLSTSNALVVREIASGCDYNCTSNHTIDATFKVQLLEEFRITIPIRVEFAKLLLALLA